MPINIATFGTEPLAANLTRDLLTVEGILGAQPLPKVKAATKDVTEPI